jgi:hypothetical protein
MTYSFEGGHLVIDHESETILSFSAYGYIRLKQHGKRNVSTSSTSRAERKERKTVSFQDATPPLCKRRKQKGPF